MARRRKLLIAGSFAVVALVGIACWGWFVWLPNYRPTLATSERLGVDVSHHQGAIDWNTVADDGISFAYVKASEGGDLVDDRFEQNWRGAAMAGLDRGAYHFFTLCASGDSQARNFLGVLGSDHGELAPALDLEIKGNCGARPSRATVLGELGSYVQLVEKATGRSVLLYVDSDFDARYQVTRSLNRPLWIRRFLRRPGGDWSVWQVDGQSKVAGISGRVDLDVMRG